MGSMSGLRSHRSSRGIEMFRRGLYHDQCGFRLRSLRYAPFAPVCAAPGGTTFAALRGLAGGSAGKQWRRAGNL
jgi:hypothetical protein